MAGQKQRVDASLQRRRVVNARQVGIPLVCRLGPGLPLYPARHHRPGLRQGAAHPVAPRVVHAWAAWRVYKIERRARGVADRAFLEKVFHKLLLNFTWWVNRKDPDGLNI